MHIPAPTFVLLDPVSVPYPWSVPCAGWASCKLFGAACTMATFSVSRPTGPLAWRWCWPWSHFRCVEFIRWSRFDPCLLLTQLSFFPGQLTEASSGGVYCAWISLGRGGASGSDSSSERHLSPLSTEYKGPLQLQLHADDNCYTMCIRLRKDKVMVGHVYVHKCMCACIRG